MAFLSQIDGHIYMVINSLRWISSPCFIYGTCVDDHGVRCQPRSTDLWLSMSFFLVRRRWYRWCRTFNSHEGIVSSQTIRRYRCCTRWHQQLLKIVQNRGLSRWVAECEGRCSVWNINSMNLWTSDLIGFITNSDLWDPWFDDVWWEKHDRDLWAESRNPEPHPGLEFLKDRFCWIDIGLHINIYINQANYIQLQSYSIDPSFHQNYWIINQLNNIPFGGHESQKALTD